MIFFAYVSFLVFGRIIGCDVFTVGNLSFFFLRGRNECWLWFIVCLLRISHPLTAMDGILQSATGN